MIFHTPWALLLFVPLVVVLLLRKKRSADAISFPGTALLFSLPISMRQRFARLLTGLQLTALTCMILAMARPQLVNTETTVKSRGIDIVIALDLSTSMLAVDRSALPRNRSRLVIAREVTREFIARRSNDRIGFIAFAARPYPVAPLTLDHDWLTAVLDRQEIGSIEDGTALGDGLLAAVNRLRASPQGSRAVVLMTDGRSNAGATSPLAAARAAQTLGVRVHTIGIGGKAPALFPVVDPLGGTSWRQVNADLDETALREIAALTGGSSYRADDADALRSVFQEIDKLEKRPIEENRSRSVREIAPVLLLSALLLFLFTQTLRGTWLRGYS